MLTPAQILPFLNHADPPVRTLAARYLRGAHDPAPVTAELIWAAINQLASDPARSPLYGALADLPQNEASLQRTAEALGAGSSVKPALLEVFVRLPFGMLARFRDVVESSCPEAAEIAQRRLMLAETPAEELWDRLTALDAGASAQTLSELAEALARHPHYAGWALNQIGQVNATAESRAAAAELLGRLKQRNAASALVALLYAQERNDLERAAAGAALVRIGIVEIIDLLRNGYAAAPPAGRRAAAATFGRLKFPRSEAAVASLIASARDTRTAAELASAAIDLACTDRSVLRSVAAVVNEAASDRRLLKQDYEALMKILGTDQPAPRTDPGSVRKSSAFAGTSSAAQQALPLAWDDSNDEELSSVDAVERGPKNPVRQDLPPPPTLSRTTPVLRSDSKVGRNDPCPCGSGKKHKKCCGR